MATLKDIIRDENSLVNWLQTIVALKEVPVDELKWLASLSEIKKLPSRTYLYKKGEEIPGTYIVIEGKFRLSVDTGLGMQEVAIFGPKDITGFLPFSRGKRHAGDGETLGELVYLFLPALHLNDMICTKIALTEALVHIMVDRVRHYSVFHQQNEKMLALGKLSAGLAHELNNPASAVSRCADLLYDQQLTSDHVLIDVLDKPIATGIASVNSKLKEIKERNSGGMLSLSEKAKLENTFVELLSNFPIRNVDDIAENLVDWGFAVEDVTELVGILPQNELQMLLSYAAQSVKMRSIIHDMQAAAGRISDLVGSVKAYTHMDKGRGKEWTNIHAGLLITLRLLEHKAKAFGVEIIKEFQDNIPAIPALPGELNQLWTNLIDNALDALEGYPNGVIKIITETAGDSVQVRITDNGPGISDLNISRIFDPFFTTKSIGKGTGIGLDIVRRIVRQHQGSIKVSSIPGDTVFTVILPDHE